MLEFSPLSRYMAMRQNARPQRGIQVGIDHASYHSYFAHRTRALPHAQIPTKWPNCPTARAPLGSSDSATLGGSNRVHQTKIGGFTNKNHGLTEGFSNKNATKQPWQDRGLNIGYLVEILNENPRLCMQHTPFSDAPIHRLDLTNNSVWPKMGVKQQERGVEEPKHKKNTLEVSRFNCGYLPTHWHMMKVNKEPIKIVMISPWTNPGDGDVTVISVSYLDVRSQLRAWTSRKHVQIRSYGRAGSWWWFYKFNII